VEFNAAMAERAKSEDALHHGQRLLMKGMHHLFCCLPGVLEGILMIVEDFFVVVAWPRD